MIGRGARDTKSDADPGRNDKAWSPTRGERRVAAWIGASVVVQGNLDSSEDTTVAGRVEGDITVRDHALVIAPGAHVEGEIVGRTVAVHGAVVGNITAGERVELGESGSVAGEIAAPRMTMAEGGVLRGRLRITPGGNSVG